MTFGVSQIAYFEPNSVPLTASIARQLWKNLSVFNDVAIAYVYQDETAIPTKGVAVPCGDVESYDRILGNSSGPFWGGFDSKGLSESGIKIAKFAFGCKSSSKWCGEETLPNTSLYASMELIEEIGLTEFVSIVRMHFEIVDRRGAIFGAVDVDFVENLLSGMVFESIVLPRMPLNRWVEQAKWTKVDPRDRVRGVYWGNYYGSEYLEKLNAVSFGDFCGEYAHQARYADGVQNGILERFDHGVFLSLSLNPLDCKPGDAIEMSTQNNLNWLIKKLVLANLL